MNIRSKLYTAVYCAIGSAAFFTSSTPALADGQDPLTKTVTYADLDISKAAGAKVLYRRIQTAAREVCPLADSTLSTVLAEHACSEHAIDEAVKNVNAIALTEMRFGTPVRLASK